MMSGGSSKGEDARATSPPISTVRAADRGKVRAPSLHPLNQEQARQVPEVRVRVRSVRPDAEALKPIDSRRIGRDQVSEGSLHPARPRIDGVDVERDGRTAYTP